MQGRLRGALPVLSTLTLGVLSFVLLSTLEGSIQQALSSRSRDLLGADLALSSRRWLSDAEVSKARETFVASVGAGPSLRETEVLELFSMVSAPGQTPQLVELVSVQPEYPLVGRLEFEAPCPTESPCVHGDDALAIRWKLIAGVSRLQIGEKNFIWGGRIREDSSRSLRGGNLAPRLIMRRSDLPATGLLRAGATFTTRKLFAHPTSPEPRALRTLARSLDQSLTDPGIQVQVPEDAATDEGRLLASVGDFLGLTSLVGLVLSFLGCYWLLRRKVQQEAQPWAIYRVLAPSRWLADRPLWLSTALLSLTAALAALVLAQAGWALGADALSGFLLMSGALPRTLSLHTFLQALFLSFGTLSLALSPSLRFLKRQSLMELLKNPQILAQRSGFTRSDFAVLLVALFGAARWVAHSWWVAGVFITGLLACSAILWLLGSGFLSLLENAARISSNPAQRSSLLALSRLRSSTLLLWITFSIGALLITLMPLLEKSIGRQISQPREAGPVPALFLFDIQEEQLEPAREWAKAQGVELQFVTPLIRGRLLEVNGTPFEKLADAPTTREEEREARFRNRGFNLTYRAELTPSERLVAGRGFGGSLGPREAVTLEKRFAERLKLKIGDRLLFDIQGVPIESEVVGLRQVSWTSFQPNFFVVFEPRALIDAPKTYLASLPSMPPESRERLQASLFEAFPNISTIDVTRVMQTLLEGFGQISRALALMALLCSVAGGVAVFSVASLRARERMGELQLLKLLGMPRRSLLASVTAELAILASASAALGLVLATLLAGTLSWFVFDSPIELPDPALAAVVLGTFLTSGALLGWLAARKVCHEPPQRWLRALTQET